MAPFVSSKGGASQFRLRESCVVPKTTGGEGGAEGAAGWIIYIYIGEEFESSTKCCVLAYVLAQSEQ